MSNLDRALKEALLSAKGTGEETQVVSARNRVLSRVRRRNIIWGVGVPGAVAALVIAALFATQTLPGRSGALPPVGDPPPKETDPRLVEKAYGCSDIPFEPSWQPEGMRPGAWVGSGGQRETPLDRQSPPAVIHYRAARPPPRNPFIDVVVGDAGSALTDTARVRTGVGIARFGAIHEGWGASLTVDGCEYTLLGFTPDLHEGGIRQFLENLVPRGEGDLDGDAFAIWPRPTPDGLWHECARVGGRENATPQGTVTAFARETFEWPDPIVEPGRYVFNAERPTNSYLVREASGDEPIDVIVSEWAKGCWAVQDVRTELVAGELKWLEGEIGDVAAVFELTSRGREAVERVELRVGSEMLGGTTEMPVDDFDNEIRLGSHPPTTGRSGYLLVLLRDGSGSVVSAAGRPLPSGIFATGNAG